MFLTVISGRIPGNEMTILAFVISYSENSDDISYLLDLMKNNDVNIDRRGTAIMKSVVDALFQNIYHEI